MNLKLLPSGVFFVLLIIQAFLHAILSSIDFGNIVYDFMGGVLFIVGSAMTVWSDWLFKKYRTTVKPYEKPNVLVIKGPYKFSRNPMYLGMELILIGFAMILGTIVSFISPVLYVLLIQKLFIVNEEKNLETEFGREFLRYKSRVRRWF